ncbi:hypothetical protein QAD02_022296 [Eretmocerus hayati]|uniref:Uncharacterized protein n=1 Tax=Eretmocerus hayati TaxID=131215 RepID=A0ACC2PVW6_9HYME|nr:hypothetical protein QAD02_022296 [Eretmocerus hayati]
MAGYNFKSEEDVKQFLENLHIEYKFGCYSEHKAEVCHLLGDYHESLKKDFEGAADLYKKNCDNLDYGRSCAKYGGWSLIGKGCKRDYGEAIKYLKRGCELNDYTGCANAGIVSLASKEVQGNDRVNVIKNAIKMLEKACTEKVEKACFFLSGAYNSGIEGVVEADGISTYKYAMKACEYGNFLACRKVASMHEKGERGIQKNEGLAKIFQSRANELEKDIKGDQAQIQFGQGIQV